MLPQKHEYLLKVLGEVLREDNNVVNIDCSILCVPKDAIEAPLEMGRPIPNAKWHFGVFKFTKSRENKVLAIESGSTGLDESPWRG